MSFLWHIYCITLETCGRVPTSLVTQFKTLLSLNFKIRPNLWNINFPFGQCSSSRYDHLLKASSWSVFDVNFVKKSDSRLQDVAVSKRKIYEPLA